MESVPLVLLLVLLLEPKEDLVDVYLVLVIFSAKTSTSPSTRPVPTPLSFLLLTGLCRTKFAVPLGRYGETEDVSNLALFLASDLASFINATTIVVDGGSWHNSGPMYHTLKGMVSRKKDAEKQGKQDQKAKL
jgi:hypothetical protein